jgi:hypothetical protein
MCYDRAPTLGDDMAKKTKIKSIVRKSWTTADIRELKSLAKTKIGKERIAKKLKRSPGAVGVYASKLGISLSTNRR